MDKNTMARSIKKVFASVSAVAIIGTAFVGGQSAFAAETQVGSTTINAGVLSTSGFKVNAFEGIILNGKVQTTTASIDELTVTDATGAWAGWDVTVTATQLTSDLGVLPENTLNISAPLNITAVDNGSAPAGEITPKGGSIDNGTGIKILSAPVGSGMGEYKVTFPAEALKLTVNPKDVKPGTYSSTITVTMTSGPQ